ncbi:MAG: hypothetical protein KDI31_10520 [Pseudomonadales bacterium]|nr:hypothetical protein [Pseudomonadales bacterium]
MPAITVMPRWPDPRQTAVFRPPVALLLVCLLSACGGSSGGSADTPVNAPPTSTAAPVQASTTAAQPPPTLIPAPAPDAVIRVLTLYSTGTRAHFSNIELRIAHLLNVANTVMEDSNVPVRFELARAMATDYPDDYLITEALEALTFASHPSFAQVAATRDLVEADLVTLFRPYANDGLCGYAWVGGFGANGDFSHPAEADFGYSAVAIDCSDYTLVHELGHNLGLVHSRREDPDGGSLPYGAGFGVDNDFVTIMASPGIFNAVRLPRFSSPTTLCNAQACGVDSADPVQGADATLALSQVVEQVAGYRD